MFNAARLQQDFSDAAPQYGHHATLQYNVLRKLLGRVQGRLSPEALVLDVGCGTGLLARKLAHHTVMQLDIAHGMCRQAKTPRSPAINATAGALPFADGTFDVVFSSLMLQWVTDWKQALQEMQRVLKPGGWLAFSTFGAGTLAELEISFAAVDSYPHVSTFLAKDELPFAAEEEAYIEYYRDAFSLMQRLKNIGARNKLLQQRKSLMTPGQMLAMQNRYRRLYSENGRLRATWNILYVVTRKP